MKQKNKPITKQLSEKFGGTWINIPFQGLWISKDLNAHACYVANGGYDVNGEYMEPLFKQMYVYGLEGGPQQF